MIVRGNSIFTHSISLSLVASILAGIGLIHPQFLWPLTLLGLTLFIHILLVRTANTSLAFLQGILFGLISTAATLAWAWDTLPLTAHGISSVTIGVLVIFVAISCLSATSAAVIGVGAILIFHIRQSAFRILYVAILWTLVEEARMWVFTITAYAPGIPLEPHFSFLSLGYSLVESHSLLQLADPFGIRGLSFITGLFAGTLALLGRPHKTWKDAYIALGTLGAFLVGSHFFGSKTIQEPIARVALITSYVESEASYEQVRSLFEQARADASTTLILLPENITLEKLYPEDDIKEILEGSPSIISSGYTEDPHNADHATMRITLRSKNGPSITQDKRLLVPFGEYLPSLGKILLSHLFPIPSVEQALLRAESTVQAGTSSVVFSDADLHVGVHLCSELFSPSLYKDLTSEGATVLINLSNRSWFHESRLLHQKVVEAAKVQAVMTKRPFLVASNGAPSFVISAEGMVIAETTWGEEGVLFVDLP